MHTIKGVVRRVGIITALAVLLVSVAHAQTDLNFNEISTTVEGAVSLSWNSTPGEYYEIDYADSLIDTNTGTITWKLLYDDYPAQGSTTLWLDTGNYFIDPIAPHPSKSPARFYRIVLSGTNTANPPLVSVVSPGNGASLSGTTNVTVAALSDQPMLYTKLYVDGQEMQEASSVTNYLDNGTNHVLATYVLNTCEWANGTHTLFATAECESGPSGPRNTAASLVGRAASSFVPVVYSNLITRVAFSEPFFVPEDGQTQHVTAVFAANVNWTLQIQDANSNIVRTATGQGGSMNFGWDGTGDGGNNLPVGNYTYLISAQPNGLAIPLSDPQMDSPLSPLSDTASTDTLATTDDWFPTSARQAVAAGWDFYYVKPPPMPPVRTNGVWVPWEDVYGPHPLIKVQVPASTQQKLLASATDTGIQPNDASPNFAGPQTTPAPVRPPTAPTRGRFGWFGVAYDTYRGVASGYTLQPPFNGLSGFPSKPRVLLENENTVFKSTFTYGAMMPHIAEAHNFIKEMKRGNWAMSFDRYDDALSINDLRASGANIFNNVGVGLLLCHGTYGSSQDFTANGCQQMYFPITAGAGAEYLRMSEMNLGSADTNGLKWMAIHACYSLNEPNWWNMQNYGIQPFNGNLHLLLGMDLLSWTDPNLEANWAKYMTRGKNPPSPLTIQDAWFTAARDTYGATGFNYTNPIVFSVTGDRACMDDRLQTNSVPGAGIFYNSQQVWP